MKRDWFWIILVALVTGIAFAAGEGLFSVVQSRFDGTVGDGTSGAPVVGAQTEGAAGVY
jgi:hypothetical protein